METNKIAVEIEIEVEIEVYIVENMVEEYNYDEYKVEQHILIDIVVDMMGMTAIVGIALFLPEIGRKII